LVLFLRGVYKFKINKIDKYAYVKNKYKCYVTICVDDKLILSSNIYMIKSTKKTLTNKFDMKDLGVVNVTLKIKISIIFYGLVFSLNLIILKKKLDNFFKNDNNIFKILIDISVHMSKNKGE